jgi:hypothetical protein
MRLAASAPARGISLGAFFFGFLGFILPLEEKKKEDRGPKNPHPALNQKK